MKTRKIVINSCFGGFSLSPAAVKRYAELKGRECYFFRRETLSGPYTPIPIPNEAPSPFKITLTAFDIPNPNEKQDNLYSWHELSFRPKDRTDPDLIRVVEELGDAANGAAALLRVIEIPDDVEWDIDDYDGVETIHEIHRSWS